MLLDDCHISFLNLNHRTDRLAHMQAELDRVGIVAKRMKGNVFNSFDLSNPKLYTMLQRTPGAIGCHYGQVSIMEESLARKKHAFVMEDDLVFCSDIKERLTHIEGFLNSHPWDIFWLGGTYHTDYPYWHNKSHHQLRQCNCSLNRDYEITEDPRIVRTYGAFSTFAYIVNVNSIEKILRMLEENIHFSIGIDFLFIYLQPQLFTYAFNPGCVKQIDNVSDIGTGITYFSGFSKLGPHWWADKL